MENNNAYFEHMNGFFKGLSEDEIVEQIQRYEIIKNHLNDDQVWKLLLQDINLRCQRVDDNWQDANEKQIDNLKILKKAFMMIRDLPARYEQDLEFMKQEIKKRSNIDEIEQDYDAEGIE